MILLDTCSLLWLGLEQKKLSNTAKKIISENSENLFVSSISAFEIGLKYKQNKLELPLEPSIWFLEILNYYSIQEISLDSNIALISANLPFIHKDPADRFIIATAIKNNFKILTKDKYIHQYEIETIW